MKKLFTDVHCPHCKKKYDPTYSSCPFCGERGVYFEEAKAFDSHIHLAWWRQLVVFVIGLLGFQILGTLASYAVLMVLAIQNTGMAYADLLTLYSDYLATGSGAMIVNGCAYLATAGILFAIIYPNIKEFLKPFANWKAYAGGGIAFAAMMAFSLFWSTIIQLIPGYTGSNANQNTINLMVTSYPLLSIIVFGLIGPLCEEVAYRAGLFSFLKRWNSKWAYPLAAIIFGLIHFSWESIGTDAIVNELLNIPDYIVAGLIFCFVYDKMGFGASSMAHISNNLLSIIATILVSKLS